MSGQKKLMHLSQFTKISGFFCTALLCSVSLFSNNLDAEQKALPTMGDFYKILTYTYENNPDLSSAVIDQRITAEGVPKALSGWRPSFDLKGSHSNTKTERPASARSRKQEGSDSGQAVATYNLYEGGRTVSSVRAAKASVKAGFAGFAAKEQSILFEAAQAYFQLLKAISEVKVNTVQELRLKKQLDSIKTQAEIGEKSQVDLEEARTDYVKSINRRLIAEQNVELRKALFTQITQVVPDVSKMTLPVFPNNLFPKTLEEATQMASTMNPGIIQARETITSRQESIGIARASLLPRVDVSASARKTRATMMSQNQYQSMVEVSVPLYGKGGADWSDLRKTTEEKAKSKREFVVQRAKFVREAAEAWAQWSSAKKQIPYWKTQIKSAKILVDGRRQEYKAGEKVLLAVTEAEDKLIQAEVGLLNAAQDESIQACRLLTSIGRFSANAMNLPVNRHQVESHYNKVKNKWIGGTNHAN